MLIDSPSLPQRKFEAIPLPWSFLPIHEASYPHPHPFSMALQRVSALGGSWRLVPDQREAQLRLSLSWGIQRLCWTGRRRPGVCEVEYGNEREGWFVPQLVRPVVDGF